MPHIPERVGQALGLLVLHEARQDGPQHARAPLGSNPQREHPLQRACQVAGVVAQGADDLDFGLEGLVHDVPPETGIHGLRVSEVGVVAGVGHAVADDVQCDAIHSQQQPDLTTLAILFL